MRVCYVANPNSIHVQRWLRYFAELGHDVHLIGEHEPSHSVPSGVTFYDLTARLNVRKIRYLVWGFLVRQLVHRIRPDILHAHQVASAGWLGAAARYHPLIVTAWGSDLLLGARHSRLQRQCARWVFRQADYVTCVSEDLAREARLLGADTTRLEVVPWGVDTGIFQPASPGSALRAQFGLRHGPVVMSVRAMHAVYNPLDIAETIHCVLEKVPSAQFIVRTHSCDPDLLAKFQSIVREHGASESVHYVGGLPNDRAIADVYRLADVAISFPLSDGTPQSVLEALACGVVPVLSDLPSLREWVRHEQEALFVPVRDVGELTAAVVRLLTDSALRSCMASRGVQLVQRRADSKKMMRYNELIYERLA